MICVIDVFNHRFHAFHHYLTFRSWELLILNPLLIKQEMKIAIVEDELIIATNIWRKLIAVGYEAFAPCSSFNEAIALLESETPDIILIDIRIKGQRDGIELAEHIRENYDMPIIFVTANGDASTIERAKMARPNAYVVKPFTKQDLHAAIEIACLNFIPKQGPDAEPKKSNFAVLKAGHDLVRIHNDEILYISTEGNYVALTLKGERTKRIRTTLSLIEEQLDKEIFCRISRFCIVNLNHVEVLEKVRIKVAGNFLDISRNYRNDEHLRSLLEKSNS
jgi:DNA-binding LytR/AlgR family response regulator